MSRSLRAQTSETTDNFTAQLTLTSIQDNFLHHCLAVGILIKLAKNQVAIVIELLDEKSLKVSDRLDYCIRVSQLECFNN